MIHRPVDVSGDILPVLSSSGLLRGAEAVARLVEERLSLYAGDWWENSGWGNGILQMLREGRIDRGQTLIMLHTGGVPGIYTSHHRIEMEKELIDHIHII